MLSKRVRDNTKTGGKYFQNNIPIMDGQATIYTMPVSGNVWQFRMWIKEEDRQVRLPLRTKDITEALDKGRQQYSEMLLRRVHMTYQLEQITTMTQKC